MAQSKVVLSSLADLAQLLDIAPPAEAAAGPPEAAPAGETGREPCPTHVPESGAEAVDLHALLAELQAAGAALTSATERDREARSAALGQLDGYDALVDRQREAEEALSRARQVRRDAEALAAAAFTEEARVAADAVARTVAEAEAGVSRLAAQRREDAERMATQPVLQRLLEERRRAEEHKDTAAAEAERARRLQDGLAAVQAVLAAGQFQEAGAMLGPLAKDHPDSADVPSLRDIIRRRAQAVKVSAAEEALRTARRTYRQAPAEAVARLQDLDIRDLPEDLLRQIKGIWAAACARLCHVRGVTAPLLRYLPAPAHGLVVAREQEGCYRVVGALGAHDWTAGSLVPETFLRQARPLRATGH